MKTKVNRIVPLVFVVITAATLISACASLPLKPPEEALRQRVEGLMNARINNDWGEVYKYLAPDYRKGTSKKEFIQRKREMHFLKFSIDSIEIDPSGKEATVKVKYDLRMKVFTFKDQVETQKWIKTGFIPNWYLHIEN